jgi:hypothetical protein
MAASMLVLCVVWILLGARNPIFFERYYVALGPVLALVLVLDGVVLVERMQGRAATPVLRRTLAIGALLTALVTLGLRWPELSGRLVEVFVPYHGPVDRVVETLSTRFPDPAALTIATNYEAEPYMFYLGSRVVGRFHAASEPADAREAAVVPDVVVPRTGQPKRLPEVRRYLIRGGYESERLAVADWPYNNVPELFTGGVLTTPHRFRSPEPGEGMPPLVVYVRAP